GAELHLWPDQDAADPARLALDHGVDGRSGPDRLAARTFRLARYRRSARTRPEHRRGAAGRIRHRAPSAGGRDAGRTVAVLICAARNAIQKVATIESTSMPSARLQ